MNKCPRCGNEEVQKFIVIGRDYEHSTKYCDQCVQERPLGNSKIIKEIIVGKKK